ncbi:MAG TPA: hypothetical protein DCW29_03955, partial [Janthinobacterium sp.]|nr:hypothetical protein [Janthinobacterium sp.]
MDAGRPDAGPRCGAYRGARHGAALLVFGLLYFGAARLGLLLAFANSNVSPVWPPSGIAFAV